MVEGSFLASVDYGHFFGVPIPRGIHLGSSLLFECAICLSVVGSVTHMMNSLGISGKWYAGAKSADDE